MPHVIVHIDRLVLNGFRPEDGHAVGAGLQQELERVFAGREAMARLVATGDLTRLQVGRLQIGHGATPHRVGADLARGIDREIGQ